MRLSIVAGSFSYDWGVPLFLRSQLPPGERLTLVSQYNAINRRRRRRRRKKTTRMCITQVIHPIQVF